MKFNISEIELDPLAVLFVRAARALELMQQLNASGFWCRRVREALISGDGRVTDDALEFYEFTEESSIEALKPVLKAFLTEENAISKGGSGLSNEDWDLIEKQLAEPEPFVDLSRALD